MYQAPLPLSSSPDNRLEDDHLFDDSFNPLGAAPKVPAEPTSRQPTVFSDCVPPNNDSAPPETQGVSVKTEPTSPECNENETEAQRIPTKTKPAFSVCSDTKASTDNTAPHGEVGRCTVKLGKRSAGERARAEEFLENLVKLKQENVEDSSLNKVAKVEPPEVGPKKERR